MLKLAVQEFATTQCVLMRPLNKSRSNNCYLLLEIHAILFDIPRKLDKEFRQRLVDVINYVDRRHKCIHVKEWPLTRRIVVMGNC